MLLPVLISALVGGVIGYSTNWFAVKMLFRPLQERHIGPWRVPFTPGLIPKKRAELARSLGHTVAQYLVTPDTLTTAFQHPQLGKRLEELVSDVVERLRSEERSLAELLQEVGLGGYLDVWPERLANKILQVIAEDGTSELLRLVSRDLPLETLAPSLASFVTAVLGSKHIREQFLSELEQILERVQVDESKRLVDLVPIHLQQAVHNRILMDSPLWLDRLHEHLQTPASKQLIESFIQRMLTGSTMLRLFSAFADTGKLADALVQSLKKEEVRTQIVSQLLTLWQRLMEQPAASLAAKVKLQELSQWEWLNSPQLMATLQDKLQQVIRNSGDVIGADPELARRLDRLAQDAIDLIISSPASQRALVSCLRRLLMVTPAQLLGSLELPSPAALAPRLQGGLQWVAAAYGPELLSLLRLTEVVEAQVNDLDIIQVEEILLQVMRDQLAAITNLGFLLGALIGTITPFLNQLLGR